MHIYITHHNLSRLQYLINDSCLLLFPDLSTLSMIRVGWSITEPEMTSWVSSVVGRAGGDHRGHREVATPAPHEVRRPPDLRGLAGVVRPGGLRRGPTPHPRFASTALRMAWRLRGARGGTRSSPGEPRGGRSKESRNTSTDMGVCRGGGGGARGRGARLRRLHVVAPNWAFAGVEEPRLARWVAADGGARGVVGGPGDMPARGHRVRRGLPVVVVPPLRADSTVAPSATPPPHTPPYRNIVVEDFRIYAQPRVGRAAHGRLLHVAFNWAQCRCFRTVWVLLRRLLLRVSWTYLRAPLWRGWWR
jgi:hypothetical protein